LGARACERVRAGLDDLVGSDTKVIDDGKLTLLPALGDSHEHLTQASRNTRSVSLLRAPRGLGRRLGSDAGPFTDPDGFAWEPTGDVARTAFASAASAIHEAT
jgi:hypothetical protein